LLTQLPAGAPVAGHRYPPRDGALRRLDAGHEVAPRGLAPRVAGRAPAVLPAPRWTALAIAAALILTVVGLQTSVFNPVMPATRASAVVGATLVRDGVAGPLIAGAELEVGDEIRTAPDGRATLEFGDSRAAFLVNRCPARRVAGASSWPLAVVPAVSAPTPRALATTSA
jgi:hypothetical protein